jgi:transposase InsO family protein
MWQETIDLGAEKSKPTRLDLSFGHLAGWPAPSRECIITLGQNKAPQNPRSRGETAVVDQFTRECVCLEADRAMTGMQVAQALERAKAERGRLPGSITVDNGSEFSSRALEAWVMGHDVQLCFIRPGRPVENGFIESFNGRLRDEFERGMVCFAG